MKGVLGAVCVLALFAVAPSSADAQCFVQQQQVFASQQVQCVGGQCFVSNGFQQQFIQPQFIQPQFIQPQFVSNRGFVNVRQPVFISNRGFVSNRFRQPVFISNRGFVSNRFRQPVFISNRGFFGQRQFVGGGFGFSPVRNLSLLGVFGRNTQRFSAFRAGLFGF